MKVLFRRGQNPSWAIFAGRFFAVFLLLFATHAWAEVQKWDVRKTVSPNQSIEIQTMYNIRRSTCEWQVNPPVPEVLGKLKLGKVAFSKGKATPHQCPDLTIDANFATYTAGPIPGKEKFSVLWRSTEGNTHFRVRYIITVK